MSYFQDNASKVDQVRKHASFLPDIVVDSDLQNAVVSGKAVYADCSNLGPHNGSPQSSQNTLSQPMSLDSSPHLGKFMKTCNSSNFTQSTKSTDTLGVRTTPARRPPQFNEEIGELRSVYEIPPQYRHIFSAYPAFNVIQSRILDTVLYSDRPMVISAPTGSGKTVVFELAIVRLLMKMSDMKYTGNFKIVYMAPVKALCAERYQDWQEKFSCLGLNCQEITGDSVDADLEELSNYNLVLTTPEKWDSLTRRWKQNKQLVQVVKLFLIDEVHLVSDEKRGPTLEAVVSRMKTVQETLESKHNHHSNVAFPINIRFLAVSATIPNIEDVATWLGDSVEPAYHIKFGEEYRPVKLQQVVLGFEHHLGQSPYLFEMNLSYRLRDVLFKYAENKPTLIFCSTRKGVVQTVETLSRQITFSFNDEQSEKICFASKNLVDNKLRGFLMAGVGAHHAGMDVTDRHIMEELFRKAVLPVLVTTTTLAMGVNLPAHLVIIKSTQQYIAGIYQDYSDSQLLQMIGRAGRPQFDTSATAVIMTKTQDRARYLRLVGGSDLLESSLHLHLGEHLNSEIVLETITDKFIAMEWIRSTFLYVRAIKNPKHYGISGQLTKTAIENNLQDLVMRELNILASTKLINMEDIMDLRPTEAGKLMATFYTSVKTMKAFNTVTGNETLEEMVAVITNCQEFTDMQLRRSEKRTLNLLNRAKDSESIRFPFKGVVKDNAMKVNVLLQAVFSCITIHDNSLHQDAIKIMRMGERISKCLARFLFRDEHFKSLLNGTILAKCFYSKLWENSIYVTRQLKKIGPVYSAQLASAGKTTFQSIIEANPRDLERILHKPPPLGNELKEAASHLPHYGLEIHLADSQNTATITLTLVNLQTISEYNTAGPYHWLTFLVGDSNNKVLVKERFKDEFLIQLGGSHNWYIDIDPLVEDVHVCLISDHWVGIDVQADAIIKNAKERQIKATMKKALEAHILARGLSNAKTSSASKKITQVNKPKTLTIIEQVKNMGKQLPEMNIKRFKCDKSSNLIQTNLDKFLYTPAKNKKLLPWKEFVQSHCNTSAISDTSMQRNSAVEETSNAGSRHIKELLDRDESDIEWIEDTPPSTMSNFQGSTGTHLNYPHDGSVLPKCSSLNILGNNINTGEYSPTQPCMKHATSQSVSPQISQSSTHFSNYEVITHNAEVNSSSPALQWKHLKVNEIKPIRQRSVDEIYKICKPVTDHIGTKFSKFEYYQENREKSFPWATETVEYSPKCCTPAEVHVHQELLETKGLHAEARTRRELSEAEARTLRELPEIEASSRRHVPGTEANTLRQLPKTEARAIRQLPEAEARTIRQLPEPEARTVRPETEARTMGQLPEAEARTIREVREAEARTLRQLPEIEASSRRPLAGTEARTLRQLPEIEARAIRHLYEVEESPTRQLLGTEARTVKHLPEAEARMLRPETEARALRHLPEAEASTLRQLPETEASPRRQLPETEPRSIRLSQEAEAGSTKINLPDASTIRADLPETKGRIIRQLADAEVMAVIAEVSEVELSKKTDTDNLELQYRQKIVLPHTQKTDKEVEEPVKNRLPKHYYPIFIKNSEDSMSFSDAPHVKTYFARDNFGAFHSEENNPKEIQLAIKKAQVSDMKFRMEAFSIEEDKNGSYPESQGNVQFQVPKLDFDLGLDVLLESRIVYESPKNNSCIAGSTKSTTLSKQNIPIPISLDKKINTTRKYKIRKIKWDPNDPVMALLYGSPTTTTKFGLNKVTEDNTDTFTYEDDKDIFKSKVVEHIEQQPCSFENRTRSALHCFNENSSTATAPSVTVPPLQNIVLQQTVLLGLPHIHADSNKNERFACVTEQLSATLSPKQCHSTSQLSSERNSQQINLTHTQENIESPSNSSSSASPEEHNRSDFKWTCSQETFTQRSTVGNLSQSEDSDSDSKDRMSPLSITRENSYFLESPELCTIQPRCIQQTKQHDNPLQTDQYELYTKNKSDIQTKYEIEEDVSPVTSHRPIKATIPMQEVSQRQNVNSFQTRNIIANPYPMTTEYFQCSPVKCKERNSSPNGRTEHDCSAIQKMCTQVSQQYGPLRERQCRYTWPSPKLKHINIDDDPYEHESSVENHENIQPKDRHCTQQWVGETLSPYYRSPQHNNMHSDGEETHWQNQGSTQQHTQKCSHLSHQNEQMGDDPNIMKPVEYMHRRLVQSPEGYSPPNSNSNTFSTRLVHSGKYTPSQLEPNPSRMRYYLSPIHHSTSHSQVVPKTPDTNDVNNYYFEQMHHSSQDQTYMRKRLTLGDMSPQTENGPEYLKSNSEYSESTAHELDLHKYRKRQHVQKSHQLDSEKKVCYMDATAKRAKLKEDIKPGKKSPCAQPVRTVSEYFQQLHPVQGAIETKPKTNTAGTIQPNMHERERFRPPDFYNRAMIDGGKLFSYCLKTTPSFNQVCSSKSRKKGQL